MKEKGLRLIKEIVKKEGKTYSNYVLVIPVNEKSYRVAINPKTFGKGWTHPMVRQAFTLLDLGAEIVHKDYDKNIFDKNNEERGEK